MSETIRWRVAWDDSDRIAPYTSSWFRRLAAGTWLARFPKDIVDLIFEKYLEVWILHHLNLPLETTANFLPLPSRLCSVTRQFCAKNHIQRLEDYNRAMDTMYSRLEQERRERKDAAIVRVPSNPSEAFRTKEAIVGVCIVAMIIWLVSLFLVRVPALIGWVGDLPCTGYVYCGILSGAVCFTLFCVGALVLVCAGIYTIRSASSTPVPVVVPPLPAPVRSYHLRARGARK